MHNPIWSQTSSAPRFPQLEGDGTADVVVIGGGITGATAAYLLQKQGESVVLLERDRCCSGDTGRTTAHITQVTDLRLSKLAAAFGRDHAQAVWDAGHAAQQQIYDIMREERVACDFRWLPGFLHASLSSDADERPALQEDAKLANELGFTATFLEEVPLVRRPGIRFPNQASFHPLKYLSGLLQAFSDEGGRVFEQTEVDEITEQPQAVRAGGHRIACNYVVIATHVPLMGKSGLWNATLLQSKLAPYTSYAIGARLPAGAAAPALFWNTSDPYSYLRIDRSGDHTYAISGGEDHKTGQADDTRQRFDRLAERLHSLLPDADVQYRWSGQVVETNDGLPYIGETAPRQFAATGFSGNGMTFGTLAAMMACDAVLGRANPWSELFKIDRAKWVGGAWDYLKENLDYPYYMLKDRLSRAEGKSLRSVARGEGKILKLGGRKVAVFRDIDGRTSAVSPICTHMGCIVHWNAAERTWDCPCHGSRFQPNGKVVAGPAEAPLPPENTFAARKAPARVARKPT